MFCLKTEQECIIRFKNLRRRGEFLHLIIQDCEFFKRLRKSKSLILIKLFEILELKFRFGVNLV